MITLTLYPFLLKAQSWPVVFFVVLVRVRIAALHGHKTGPPKVFSSNRYRKNKFPFVDDLSVHNELSGMPVKIF